MGRKSDVRKVLDRMSMTELREHCDEYGVQPARSAADTRKRLARAVGTNLDSLVSKDGAWSLESWKDWAYIRLDAPKRKSWDDQVREMRAALHGGTAAKRDDPLYDDYGAPRYEWLSYSVTDVRESPDVVEELAELLSVTPPTVLRRLKRVHGRTLVKNVMSELDPSGALARPDRDGDESDDEAEGDDEAYDLEDEDEEELEDEEEEEEEELGEDDDDDGELSADIDEDVTVAASSTLVSTLPLVPPGTLLADRFKVKRVLGKGGFGAAYLVEDTVHPSRAPKVVKFARTPEKEERLRQEFQIADKLRHRAICTYLDMPTDEEHGRFVVMDYAGESLSDLIAIAPDRLTIPYILHVVREIAAALDHAHKKGVLHQDVKPANILVNQLARGEIEAKLTDFGISIQGRAVTMTPGRHTVVATSMVGYTDSYAAPEQRLGRSPRKASDQYSLALVACAMLERKELSATYERSSFSALESAQDAALKRALSWDPDGRFDTCRDFALAFTGRSS